MDSKKVKVKKRSQLDNIWRQFKKNKLAMLGLIVFVLLVFMAVICPLFINYDADVILQNNQIRLQAPNAAHLFGKRMKYGVYNHPFLKDNDDTSGHSHHQCCTHDIFASCQE